VRVKPIKQACPTTAGWPAEVNRLSV